MQAQAFALLFEKVGWYSKATSKKLAQHLTKTEKSSAQYSEDYSKKYCLMLSKMAKSR